MAGHIPGRGSESLPESLSLSLPLFFLFISFFLTDFDLGHSLTVRSVVSQNLLLKLFQTVENSRNL